MRQREIEKKKLGEVKERESSGKQMNLIFNDALRLNAKNFVVCVAGEIRGRRLVPVALQCHFTVCNMQRVAHNLHGKKNKHIRLIHGILFACNF